MLIQLVGCVDSRKNYERQQVIMEFTVDSSLVNNEKSNFPELGFTINFPLNFAKIETNDSLVRNVIARNQEQNVTLKEAYASSNNKSFSFVFDLRGVTPNEYNIYRQGILDTANTVGSIWNSTSVSTYNYSCLSIEQFLLYNNDYVCFKLVCQDRVTEFERRDFEIVYLLSRDFYQENIKSVESSIGSINCINTLNY